METKPGVKTSELWVVVGTIISLLLQKKLGLDLDPTTIAAAASTAVGYALSRAHSKKAPKLPPFLAGNPPDGVK